MKLAGLKKRFSSFVETVETYSLVTIMLSLICMLINVLIWYGDAMATESVAIFGKILMVGFLIIILCIIITKVTEGGSVKWALSQGLLLVFAVCYYLLFPGFLDDVSTGRIIQHAIVQFCVILGLLVIPLRGVKRGNNSVYQAILHLLLHAALAAIFVGILASGISIALLGIETLFEVSIVGEWYVTIYATIGIMLGGLTFIDGYRSRDVGMLTTKTDDAKWKTMLGRVVGVLLLIYAVILYVYLGKILITGVRPSGEVTTRGFIFSILVILGSILLIPLVESDEYSRFRTRCLLGLYGSLIPVGVMVAVAISMRVEQYGLTESRYLVIAILAWLMLSSIYMIASKKKDLWTIPALLLLFGLIAAFGGPVSARGLSYTMQYRGLQNIIKTNDITNDSGVLVKEKIGLLDNETQISLGGKIEYIIDAHGIEKIHLITGSHNESSYEQLTLLGLQNSKWGNEFATNEYYNSEYKYNEIVDVSGFSSYYQSVSNEFYSYSGAVLTIGLEGENHLFDLTETIQTVREIGEQNSLPDDVMTIEYEDKKLFIDYISLQKTTSGDQEIASLGFSLLLK